MMKKIGLLILCASMLASCRMRQSALQETKSQELPADLDGQVALLTGVKDAIPPLFKEATRFMVNMLELIEEQRELLATLEQQNLYKDQLKARGAARGIEVDVATDKVDRVVQRRIDPQAIGAWTQKMIDTLDQVVAARTSETLAQAMESFVIARLPQALEFSSLMTGVILGAKNLRQEQRAELLKLSPVDKAKRFASEAWDLSGFDLKRFPGVGTLADLPKAVQRSREAYEASTLGMAMLVLLQDDQGVIDERVDTLKERLTAVSEADLDLFVDKEAFEKRFKSLAAKLSRPAEAQKILAQSIREVSQTTITENIKVEGVRLEAADHRLAMFRGMASGDCSTEYSAGFSALPTEHVFFIYDSQGRILGYVAATVVMVGEQPKLYVHTMAGKRLQASHALSAFEGLRQWAVEMEFAGMVLPDKSRLASFNNFAAPRGVFENLLQTRGKASVAVRYTDAALRDIVHQTNSASYDMPSFSPTAVEIDVATSFVAGSQVRLRESALLANKPRQPSPEELRFLVMDLITIGREGEAEIIAAKTGHDIESFKALDELFRNDKRLALAQYQQAVLAEFAKIGVAGLSASLFDQYPYYFTLGWLRAPDAFRSEHLGDTIERWVEELRVSGIPEIEDDIYEKNKEAIAGATKFAAYVRTLDPTDAEDRTLVQTLVQKIGGGAWTDQWVLAHAKKFASGGDELGGAYRMASFIREARSDAAEVQEILREVVLRPHLATPVRRELLEAVAASSNTEVRNEVLIRALQQAPENRVDVMRSIVRLGLHRDPRYRSSIDLAMQGVDDPLTKDLLADPFVPKGMCEAVSDRMP